VTAAGLALLLVLAAAAPVRKAVVGLAPPELSPPPPCVPAERLPPGEMERLRRFAALPHGYLEWKERNCFPPRLDDRALSRIVEPAGIVVAIGTHDVLVVDPGRSWAAECAAVGIPGAVPRPVTGSDLLTVLEEIRHRPALASADLREVGLSVARTPDGTQVYALVLGTPRAIVRVQCFEDRAVLAERAEAALYRAEQASR
jgi:hypothetical protein